MRMLPVHTDLCPECLKPLGTASYMEACVHVEHGVMYAAHPACCVRCPKRVSWRGALAADRAAALRGEV